MLGKCMLHRISRLAGGSGETARASRTRVAAPIRAENRLLFPLDIRIIRYVASGT